MVGDFLARLEANRTTLDELNVFPVADNDTGSNMVFTLASISAALEGVTALDVAAAQVESAALDGRGNSGLIIGQFLAGFFFSFEGDRIDLERGVSDGARWARRAVAKPVEGTMLTVADVAAATLQGPSSRSLDALVVTVAAAVEATPTQLAVLAKRGVVDSGAAGLLLFFEALHCVMGDSPDRLARRSGATDTDLIVCNVGLGDAAPAASAYEIQFRVPATLVGDDELRELLLGIGTDVVVASSADEHAAHVHVVDPHLAAAAISGALEGRPGAKAISYDVEPIIETGRQA